MSSNALAQQKLLRKKFRMCPLQKAELHAHRLEACNLGLCFARLKNSALLCLAKGEHCTTLSSAAGVTGQLKLSSWCIKVASCKALPDPASIHCGRSNVANQAEDAREDGYAMSKQVTSALQVPAGQ
jgi:hypothetical protein